MTEKKDIMTRKEVAKYFKVTPETVTAWSKMGMPCIFVGRVQTHDRGARTRYYLQDCIQWTKNRSRI